MKSKIITEPGTLHKDGDPIGNSKTMEKLEIIEGIIWPGINEPSSKLEVKDSYDTIFFSHDQNLKEILKLCPNGDIFVHGKLITNDMEVVDALKEWLSIQGYSFVK